MSNEGFMWHKPGDAMTPEELKAISEEALENAVRDNSSTTVHDLENEHHREKANKFPVTNDDRLTQDYASHIINIPDAYEHSLQADQREVQGNVYQMGMADAVEAAGKNAHVANESLHASAEQQNQLKIEIQRLYQQIRTLQLNSQMQATAGMTLGDGSNEVFNRRLEHLKQKVMNLEQDKDVNSAIMAMKAESLAQAVKEYDRLAQQIYPDNPLVN